MKKKLLYIGHSYHNKTKSSQFLQDILQSAYDVEFCNVNPDENNPEANLDYLSNQEFDVLVLFQVMLDIDILKSKLCYKYPVFFPMLDGSGFLENDFWEAYRDFNIINFSRTLHERLLHLGLSSYYIQYFPKPFDSFEYGDSTHVFFWQRMSELNIDLIEKLLRKIQINKIHIHKALDPFQEFKEPSKGIVEKIEYSDWYETRDKMLKDVESCAIYIAPRPYEGIGMGFLEAMAMGRCVLAPDNPTMNEYIIHGSNGLLYDSHLPSAVKVNDIRKIQENAFEYIKSGYAQWEKDKYKIIDWLEAPIQQTATLSSLGSSSYISVKSYHLLGVIPFWTVKNKLNRRYYYLFNFLRVMKSRRKSGRVIFYLFDFIPIWKV